MKNRFSADSAILIGGSVITLALLALKVDIPMLQRIVAVLLLLLLILSNKTLSGKNANMSLITRRSALLLGTLFIQLIVLSTGNLKSPFLVLIHLFTLSVGFLIGVGNGFLFLLLTLGALFLSIYLDKNISGLFLDDPGSLLLYLVSFLVILPLSVLLTRYYYLKDSIVNLLTRQIKLKEEQEQALLEGLNEVILAVDREFIAISANEAAEKALAIPRAAIIKRPIFDFLFLKNKNNTLISKDSLPLNKVFYEKEFVIIDDLLFLTKNTPVPKKVSLQIRPVFNLEGAIDHLILVIKDKNKIVTSDLGEHTSLDQARVKQQAMLSELKDKLTNKNLPDLKARTELLERFGHDILMVVEVEDHAIEQRQTFLDIAEACKRRVFIENDFAKLFGVEVNLSLLNFDAKNLTPIVPKGLNISPDMLTSRFFTTKIDPKWFDILITRLLDMAILLSSRTKSRQVSLSIDRGEDQVGNYFLIKIATDYSEITKGSEGLLFTKYYGILGSVTNLRIGSGLEGFIAKTLASSLSIQLQVEKKPETNGLVFSLKVYRKSN